MLCLALCCVPFTFSVAYFLSFFLLVLPLLCFIFTYLHSQPRFTFPLSVYFFSFTSVFHFTSTYISSFPHFPSALSSPLAISLLALFSLPALTFDPPSPFHLPYLSSSPYVHLPSALLSPFTYLTRSPYPNLTPNHLRYSLPILSPPLSSSPSAAVASSRPSHSVVPKLLIHS